MRASPVLSILLLSAAGFGCTFTPANNTRVSSSSSPIYVSGYTGAAGTTIRVEAASSPSGPWTTLGNIVSDSSAVPLRAGDVYSFGGYVNVPLGFWVSAGCEEEVYLRTVSPGIGFRHFTFDRVSPDGRPPMTCVVMEQNDGATLLEAAEQCASPDSPVIRLTAPGPQSVVNGDVLVRTPAEAAIFACVEEIHGDLIVREETLTTPTISLPDIVFPRLREVRGRMDLVYQQPTHRSGRTARRIVLPRLERVRGDVILSNFINPGSPELGRIEMGLERLTRIDGDLSMYSNVIGTRWSGLDALRSLPRDLTIDLGGDWFVSGLNGLVSVGRDVHLTFSSNGSGLSALRTVGRHFTQIGGTHYDSNALRQLTTVRGDMTLIRANVGPTFPTNMFRALQFVHGRLTLENSAQIGGSLALGHPSVALQIGGGLTVRQSPALTSVGLGTVSLSGTDSVSFTDNVNLCTSAIQTWINGQTGWSGTRVVTGNGGC